MDSRDLELIAKYSASDAELSALYDDHVAFEKMINKLESKSYLNSTETQEVKELKKKKLAGKTRLEAVLDKYRKAEAN
uniref:DUF465 domain-containing protein n=1 Tax=Fundidesulfovibrio putealis TaxID=270496 RepID=A0A7C4A7T1_9BACT